MLTLLRLPCSRSRELTPCRSEDAQRRSRFGIPPDTPLFRRLRHQRKIMSEAKPDSAKVAADAHVV
jgi:hypothetical protein